MAANIFEDRFIARGEPAWHHLGITFPATQKTSVSEGFTLAGLDYTYDKFPLTFRTGELDPTTGEPREFSSDQVAIVRSAHRDAPAKFLGTAHRDRGIIQNMDLAQILDPLSAEWPLETAGALGEGETIFCTLDAGDTTIAGEHIRRFYLVTDSKSATKGLQVAFTPVRVVCQNTLIAGIAAATMSAMLPHIASIQTTFKWHVDLMAALRASATDTEAAFEAVAQVRLTPDTRDAILAAAYPAPKPSKLMSMARSLVTADAPISPDAARMFSQKQAKFEAELAVTQDRREFASLCYLRINDQFPGIAGSGWALYNAIVEAEDFRQGRDNVAESALVGPRAATKARAFQAALALA